MHGNFNTTKILKFRGFSKWSFPSKHGLKHLWPKLGPPLFNILNKMEDTIKPPKFAQLIFEAVTCNRVVICSLLIGILLTYVMICSSTIFWVFTWSDHWRIRGIAHIQPCRDNVQKMVAIIMEQDDLFVGSYNVEISFFITYFEEDWLWIGEAGGVDNWC